MLQGKIKKRNWKMLWNGKKKKKKNKGIDNLKAAILSAECDPSKKL
jgi:hypothetical protein